MIVSIFDFKYIEFVFFLFKGGMIFHSLICSNIFINNTD